MAYIFSEGTRIADEQCRRPERKMYKVHFLTVIICCDQIFGLIDVYENDNDKSECFIFEKYM